MAKTVGTARSSDPASSGKRVRKRVSNAPSASNVRKELVENQMYETAVKLFALRGFAGTSLQDIADEMGITRPALYYYVESKDDILAKLVTEITETNTAEILDLATDSNLEPVARLSRIAYVMAYNRALHPTRFLLLERSEGELSEGLAKVHEENKRAMLRSIIELIKQGIDRGQFRPVNPRSAALAVIGMCNWVAWWFHEDDRSVAKQVAIEIADMAVASLLQSSARNTGLMGPGAAVALLRQDLAYLDRLLNESDQEPKRRRR
ncbi:TetR/AcrR family transcriptional regulator [Mycobacterium sp.]|uniref:TetR/AcrR family transcriptional regulator n=1 Tax=Mycobacterium sp. TaxID=1785 RepID=UPI002DAD3E77|nr:TetR/AcrR family transcriptional regulator [Mycobacterium sp.]